MFECILASKSLAGKFFYSVDENGTIQEQGSVLEMLTPYHYILQFFNWEDDHPGDMRAMRLNLMSGWLFYNSCEDMKAIDPSRLRHIRRGPPPANFNRVIDDLGSLD